MLKERVDQLLEEAFEERPDLFLISCNIGPANDIKVVIDGDEGVKLADCMFVSRAVEHQLDRDETDFSLEVLSAGAASPLQEKRQYKKNVGRELEVISNQDQRKESGKLTQVDDNGITIEWKAREPKPIGKGKVTVQKSWTVAFEDIKQAKVVIKFN
ncbi:ribosome assembly cofactor RimP [Nonlabens xiamenensis]|uniref:ribosome assembly cofactor RimP n=1 Tax=Nonlabens xiamenensis TaxID=2341043 RepID=UPI000F615770|nr:ribosome assembly cofactor RimP [Nonlabens xiamenensis]